MSKFFLITYIFINYSSYYNFPKEMLQGIKFWFVEISHKDRFRNCSIIFPLLPEKTMNVFFYRLKISILKNLY